MREENIDLQPGRGRIARVIQYVRNNSFSVVVFFFFMLIVFLGEHNLFVLLSAQRRISQIERKCEYYRDQIAEDKKRLNELRTNSENLEKFAREQYYMHRKGEDLFVVE